MARGCPNHFRGMGARGRSPFRDRVLASAEDMNRPSRQKCYCRSRWAFVAGLELVVDRLELLLHGRDFAQ